MTQDLPPTDDEPVAAEGRIARWKASAGARLDRLRERWPSLDLGVEMFVRWNRVNASVAAGHIAFRAFLWLLPTVLLVVALLSVASAADLDFDSAGTLFDLGGSTIESVESSAKEGESSRYQIASVAILGVLLGSRALVKAANLAFAQVWEIPDRKPEGLVAAAFRFLGGVVLVVMVIGFLVALRNGGPLLQTLGLGTSIAIYFLLALGVSVGLPRRTRDWRDLIPGAVIGTAGMVGLKLFSVYYLPSKIDRYQEIYGPIGLSLVFLTYLFLLSSILVTTALANAVWFDSREQFPHIDTVLQRIPGPRPDVEPDGEPDGEPGDVSGGAPPGGGPPAAGTPR